MVVINGPRFSTRAESAWFASMGWQVVNMTGYPEAWLARELGLCYANVSLITDYDVGVPGDDAPVSHDAVLAVFADNLTRVRDLLFAVDPADRRRAGGRSVPRSAPRRRLSAGSCRTGFGHRDDTSDGRRADWPGRPASRRCGGVFSSARGVHVSVPGTETGIG